MTVPGFQTPPPPAGALEFPAGHAFPIASQARHLLNTIVTTFAENGTDLPTRQYVAAGAIAADEAQVVVMFGGLAVGPPGNELNTPFRGDTSRTSTLNVELWRFTPAVGPSGSPPSAQSISAASEVLMNDAWLLLESAYASDQMGIGIVANVNVVPPSGELVGLSMVVEQTVP